MRPVDFFLVGAMKCGTSTLATQLGKQDGIFMCDPKEPNFFSNDEKYELGINWYNSLFEPAKSQDLLGEASTHYTKFPTYPETIARLKKQSPNPKIIYLIRDPLERVVSHYIHEWTMNNIHESISETIRTNSKMVDYGRYGYQIEHYVEAFGKNAVLVVALEEMKIEPDAVLTRIGSFLDNKLNLQWDHSIKPQNVSRDRLKQVPFHNLLFNSKLMISMRRKLIPNALRKKVKSAVSMEDRPSLQAGDIAFLKEIYADDFSVLRKLFPDNNSIAKSYKFLRDDN